MRMTKLYQVHLGGEMGAAIEGLRAKTGASASNVIRDLIREALVNRGLVQPREAAKAPEHQS